MARKLIINCGNCDTRNVKEDTLQAYESISINCGGVLVSPESKDLLNRYGVTMNCGNVVELEKGVKVSTVNGSTQIKPSDIVTERQYLHVNGSLEIYPGTEQMLAQYVGIYVNGSVTYPESVSGYLGMMTVNGASMCYPDGAIVLKRTAVIDRLFALRAKNSLYWSARRMVMVDPQLDGGLLDRKGARFSAREVILSAGKVAEMIGLIDERADITIVPDGTSFVTNAEELNEHLVKKHGTKLYVLGDLKVLEDAGKVLGQLEYLNVRGDISVLEALKAPLLDVLTEHSGTLKTIAPPKDRQITDKITLKISKWLLEQEGISVSDCVTVTLDEDIPPEMILERLQFTDVMKIRCTPGQEAAVGAVSEGVAAIGMTDDAADENMGVLDTVKDSLGAAFGAARNLLETKVINAGDYVL